MTAPYATRRIEVSIQLGEGNFGQGGFNTVTLSGLRMLAEIKYAVLPHPGEAVLTIWGMTLDQMNKLSVAGTQYKYRQNKVLIKAGDDQSGLTAVFNGIITMAFPAFAGQPNAPFVIAASPGPGIALPPVKPVSFEGATSVETALRQIVQPAGLKLENNGVNVTLTNPYFPGTVMDQVNAACRAADCMGTIDSASSTLAIWPKNAGRNTSSVPLIAPETGMISYPQFQTMMVQVRTIFDPTIGGAGTKFRVKSQLSAANGIWNLTQKDYLIASEMPDGPWEMTLAGYPDESSSGGSARVSGGGQQ